MTRSVLAKDISELWGQGTNYEELHVDVRQRTEHRWLDYRDASFSFLVDAFAGKSSRDKKSKTIESFGYLGFGGKVRMKNPDEQFYVMEEYVSDAEASIVGTKRVSEPRNIYMGRFLAKSNRDIVPKHDLKKRRYISTTSMDAELSLVTANMALAAPGKVFYDPFVGTGSFLVAAAHFGALTLGSDIDPRSFRGKDEEREKGEVALMRNFKQYGIESKMLDLFTSDLTNTPLRNCGLLDGITCDPPYGVREGLRVLGMRDGGSREPVYIDGVAAHRSASLQSKFRTTTLISSIVCPTISRLNGLTGSRHYREIFSILQLVNLFLMAVWQCGCLHRMMKLSSFLFPCTRAWRLSVSQFNPFKDVRNILPRVPWSPDD